MKITATAFKWMADGEGEWLMIRSPKARRALEGLREGKTYDVEIKEHRERRSLDSNAYAWVLIGKLAEAVNLPPDEIYRHYIKDIGGNYDVVCVRSEAAETFRKAWEANGIGWQTDVMPSKINGCTNVRCFYGSSTYDTKQMSRLIDLVVQDAKSVGIETKTPQELEEMMAGWSA